MTGLFLYSKPPEGKNSRNSASSKSTRRAGVSFSMMAQKSALAMYHPRWRPDWPVCRSVNPAEYSR